MFASFVEHTARNILWYRHRRGCALVQGTEGQTAGRIAPLGNGHPVATITCLYGRSVIGCCIPVSACGKDDAPVIRGEITIGNLIHLGL